ncbi:MAG: DUF4430 domain-containing protein [Coriobacteriales bacterium]|jgi:hypothetical protein|nr:DUF4430 domain-containing protein [Coriobacteriales bacterium]
MRESATKKTLQALCCLFVALLLACSGFALSACGNSASSTDNNSNNARGKTLPQTILVVLNVNASAAYGKGAAAASKIGKKGILSTKVYLPENSSILTALRMAGVKYKASKSSLGGQYLTSIEGLAAGQLGAQSGWVYQIDGQLGTTAIDQTQLHSGDNILLKYVLNAAGMQ